MLSIKDLPRGGVPVKPGHKKFISEKRAKQIKKNRIKRTHENIESNSQMFGKFDQINFKTISPGMKFLGVIKAIHDYEIKVSLPGRLVGKLPMTNISDSFNDALKTFASNQEEMDEEITDLRRIFHVGQLINTQVVELLDNDKGHQKKAIILSTDPKLLHSSLTIKDLKKNMVIPCTIKSIEDHGYIVDTGMMIQAFLSEEHAKKYIKLWGQGLKLPIGHYIWCKIEKDIGSMDNPPKIFPVSVYMGDNTMKSINKPTSIKNGASKKSSNPDNTLGSYQPRSIDALLPGTPITATVVRKQRNGYELLYQSAHPGFLPSVYATNSLSDTPVRLQIGGTLGPLLVTYVNPFTKAFACTHLPHLTSAFGCRQARKMPCTVLGMSSPLLTHLKALGIIRDAKVLKVLQSRGDHVTDDHVTNGPPANISASAVVAANKFSKIYIELPVIGTGEETVQGSAPIGFGVWKAESSDGGVCPGPGSLISCCVIDYDPMMGVMAVDFAPGHGPKSTNGHVMTYESLVVASKLRDCTVKRVADDGIVVEVGPRLRGFIPVLHASDYSLPQNWNVVKAAQMYPVGKKLICRVLDVKPETTRLILTHKRSLLYSDLPPLRSYAKARPGRLVDGFVVEIMKYGLLVAFYNSVTGLVPLSEIDDQHRDKGITKGRSERSKHMFTDRHYFGKQVDLGAMFYLGQVVRCRVLRASPTDSRMTLSLKIGDDKSPRSKENKIRKENESCAMEQETEPPVSPSLFEIGKLYNGRIVEKLASGFIIDFDGAGGQGVDGKVRASDSRDSSASSAFLPLSQLSDFPEIASLFHSTYDEGTSLSDLLCLSLRPQLVVSLKHFFKRILFPSPDDTKISGINLPLGDCGKEPLIPGSYCVGTFRNSQRFGLFVGFPNGFKALVHRKNLPISFLKYLPLSSNNVLDQSTPTFNVAVNLAPGRTLVVKVLDVQRAPSVENVGVEKEKNTHTTVTSTPGIESDDECGDSKTEGKVWKKAAHHHVVSLSLSDRDLRSDRSSVSFGDHGATLLNQYLEERKAIWDVKYKGMVTTGSAPLKMGDVVEARLSHTTAEKLYFDVTLQQGTDAKISAWVPIHQGTVLNIPNAIESGTHKLVILYPDFGGAEGEPERQQLTYASTAGTLSNLSKNTNSDNKQSEVASPYDCSQQTLAKFTQVHEKSIAAGKKRSYLAEVIHIENEDKRNHQSSVKNSYFAILALNFTTPASGQNAKGKKTSKKTSRIGCTVLVYLPFYWDFCDVTPQVDFKDIFLGKVLRVQVSTIAGSRVFVYQRARHVDHTLAVTAKPNSLSLLQQPTQTQIQSESGERKMDKGMLNRLCRASLPPMLSTDLYPNLADREIVTDTSQFPASLITIPVGTRIEAIVKKKYRNYMDLYCVSHKALARLYVTSTCTSNLQDGVRPLIKYSRGQTVTGLTVWAYQKLLVQRNLAITNPGFVTLLPLLTTSHQDTTAESGTTLESFEPGQLLTAFVENIRSSAPSRVTFLLSASVRGIAQSVDLSKSRKVVLDPSLKFQTGAACHVTVLQAPRSTTLSRYVHLSLVHCTSHSMHLPIGSLVCAKFMLKIQNGNSYLFRLPKNNYGVATLFDLADDLSKAVSSPPVPSSIHRCRIKGRLGAGHDAVYQRLLLQAPLAGGQDQTQAHQLQQQEATVYAITLRPSRTASVGPITSSSSDQAEMALAGLPGNSRARIRTISEISHVTSLEEYDGLGPVCPAFVRDPEILDEGEDFNENFAGKSALARTAIRVGHYLRGILRVVPDLANGEGSVQSEPKFEIGLAPGTFCRLEGCGQMIDTLTGSIGKVVKCEITRIVEKTKSFYGKYVDDNHQTQISTSSMNIADKSNKTSLKSHKEPKDLGKKKSKKPTSEKFTIDKANKNTIPLRVEKAEASEKLSPLLLPGQLNGHAFSWWADGDENAPTKTTVADDDSGSSSGESEDGSVVVGAKRNAKSNKEKSHTSKRAAKRLEERAETEAFIQQYKTPDQSNGPPNGTQKVDNESELEKMVMASPNSSLVWTRYMAFYLRKNDVGMARKIGKRALDTISFRDEQEKLNIWAALLNLDNMFGTEDDLGATFNQAIKFNDPKRVYLILVKIYGDDKSFEKAERTFETMVKKFGKDAKIWMEYGEFMMRNKRKQTARTVMERSLQHLEKKEHIEVILKFAQLEFEMGDFERGKTLVEKVIDAYPKRTDIWSRYVDALTKHGDVNEARAVLDRLATIKLSSRARLFAYKKFTEFEAKYGTFQRLEAVKSMFQDILANQEDGNHDTMKE